MPLLVKLGICELAAGVLSGWAMIATVERPEALKRLGVRQLGRIRQTHLDLLMQGTILVAIGAAVASVPTWIGILLVLGAFLAPLTLGVLAFRPELAEGLVRLPRAEHRRVGGIYRRLGRSGRHRSLALNGHHLGMFFSASFLSSGATAATR